MGLSCLAREKSPQHPQSLTQPVVLGGAAEASPLLSVVSCGPPCPNPSPVRRCRSARAEARQGPYPGQRRHHSWGLGAYELLHGQGKPRLPALGQKSPVS